MSKLQWIGFAIGLIVLSSRLPAVIWPVAYRDRVRALLSRGGPSLLRAIGVFLWLLAAAIAVLLITRSLSLLQSVMLVLAMAFSGAGTASLFFPESYRRFTESLLGRMPSWVIRAVGVIGVALGAWILYLSLEGS